MPKKKNESSENGAKHRPSLERKREFMEMFAREASYVRDSIVNDLPAYNMLLNIQCESFTSAALRLEARKRNIYYDKDNPPMPTCPHCGRHEKVGTKGEDAFYCNACQRKITATHNSIITNTNCDALVWMKVFMCLLNCTGLTKTCEVCSIAPSTYYSIRSRLFYALQLMMEEVKLYGVVRVDNTFVRVSYKGMDLRESEFDEESIFFDDSYIPRSARKRGGPNKRAYMNSNSICIFTGIDENSRVITRFAGVGAVSLSALKGYLPENKILPKVPVKDPFPFNTNKKGQEAQTKPGDSTLIVADKEKAIENYAKSLGVAFEAHVYRANGVQRRLAEGAHDIQKVNALHKRLKTFLRRCGYVSSKYLPGFLLLFEFIENTGASSEAIQKLFEILVTSELGKPANFYHEMFTVPNYLQEWLSSDHPLKKLRPEKRLAFYLYDHVRNKEQYPDMDIAMAYIEEQTGLTAPTIRRNYNNLLKAGYREEILRYYGEPMEDKKTRPSKKNRALQTVNPTVLSIYDEYAKQLLMPKNKRTYKTFQAFLDAMNKLYGTDYKRTNMLMKFRYIEEHGIRAPLPDIKSPQEVSDRDINLFKDYERILLCYREKGEDPQNSFFIYSELAEKYELSPWTVKDIVTKVRCKIRKRKEASMEDDDNTKEDNQTKPASIIQGN